MYHKEFVLVSNGSHWKVQPQPAGLVQRPVVVQESGDAALPGLALCETAL